jgi:hypothetical protein
MMPNPMKAINAAIRRIRRVLPGGNGKAGAQDTKRTKDLNDRINAMLEAGEDHYTECRAGIETSGVRMMFGAQVRDSDPMPDGWIPVQDNRLWPLLTHEQAVMSQNPRRIALAPLKPEDAELVKVAEGALNYVWQKVIKGDMMLLRAVIDGQTHGHWFTCLWNDEHARWNQEEHRFEDRLKCALVSPGTFRADPVAETAEDWQFAYTMRMIPVADAIGRWPEFKEQIIQAAMGEDEHRRDADREISAQLRPYQTTGGDMEAVDTSRSLMLGDRERLLRTLEYHENPTLGIKTVEGGRSLPGYVSVLEMIFVDPEMKRESRMEDVPPESLEASGRLVYDEQGRQMDSETGEPFRSSDADEGAAWPQYEADSWDQPVYPYGRHVIRFGTETIVHDAPWPYEHWLWTQGVRGILPHTWVGQNAVESAKDSQEIINQIRTYTLNYLRNHAQVETVVEEEALVGAEDLEDVSQFIASGPNRITKVHANKMGGYQRVPPPAWPSGLSQVLDRVEQDLRDIIGVQTVDQGRGEGKTLGQDVLNETKSRLRTALQTFYMDDFVVRLIEQAWEIMRARWRDRDVVKILGEGGLVQGMPMNPAMLDADFDISVSVENAMPMDRERRKRDAESLFGLLGQTALFPQVLKILLDAYDVPNAKEMLDLITGVVAGQPAQPMQPVEPGAPQPETQTPEAAPMTEAGPTGEQAAKRLAMEPMGG